MESRAKLNDFDFDEFYSEPLPVPFLPHNNFTDTYALDCISISPSGGIGMDLFLGYSVSLLGLTGFETRYLDLILESRIYSLLQLVE